MNKFKKGWIFLLFFSGSVAFAQTQAQVHDSIVKYRNSVFSHLDAGETEKIDIQLGYINYNHESVGYIYTPSYSKAYFFLTLDEIESIYLLQHNFQEVLKIMEDNEFKIGEQGQRYGIIKNEMASEKGAKRSSFVSYDSLWTDQGHLLLRSEDQILEAINNSRYGNEIKGFLNVFLKYKIAYHVGLESAK